MSRRRRPAFALSAAIALASASCAGVQEPPRTIPVAAPTTTAAPAGTTTTGRPATTARSPTTRRPACPKLRTVVDVAGDGIGQSRDFRVKDDFEIRWEFTPTGSDGVGVFFVTLEHADGELDSVVADTRLRDRGTWEGNNGDRLPRRLSIDSTGGEWRVRVVDVPEGIDLDRCGAND